MTQIKVLLVEDNEGDILLTVDALKEGKMPKKVTVVKDGWEAIQYIENREPYTEADEPDLILLDVNLPKINGHEVLRQIRTNSDKSHIPVIMLTTSSSQDDIVKSFQNEADLYIAKPVDAGDFANVVQTIEAFWDRTKNEAK
ncbi:MAG: response regulator [Flavobacterium sp.]|nr:MAG: response regulator [Flavobacterium sp.]